MNKASCEIFKRLKMKAPIIYYHRSLQTDRQTEWDSVSAFKCGNLTREAWWLCRQNTNKIKRKSGGSLRRSSAPLLFFLFFSHWSWATVWKYYVIALILEYSGALHCSIVNSWTSIRFNWKLPLMFHLIPRNSPERETLLLTRYIYTNVHSRSIWTTRPDTKRIAAQICLFIKSFWNNKIWQPHSVQRRASHVCFRLARNYFKGK